MVCFLADGEQAQTSITSNRGSVLAYDIDIERFDVFLSLVGNAYAEVGRVVVGGAPLDALLVNA